LSRIQEKSNDANAANGGVNPGSPGQDQITIPSVQQVTSLDPDRIDKDAGMCIETQTKLELWGKRRQRIIKELNEAADYLTTLHKVSHGFDFTGTSVSAIGASGAAVGAGAALFFSTTAPVSIPVCGAATVIGGHSLRWFPAHKKLFGR